MRQILDYMYIIYLGKDTEQNTQRLQQEKAASSVDNLQSFHYIRIEKKILKKFISEHFLLPLHIKVNYRPQKMYSWGHA